MGDQLIPLLRDTKDSHYRYKMPKLTAKVEGSGNGIKTVITNMTAVAKSLHRQPNYPTKFFGCELGAQTSMDEGRNEYIVNGAHDAEKLLTLLYAFIRKFVLCPKCNNPETNLKVLDKKLHQACIACGHRNVIPTTMHKLCTYIINHPPNSDSENKVSKLVAKSAKKDKKSGKKNDESSSPTTDEQRRADEAAQNNDDDFDEFEDDDLTSDAYNERMKALTEGFQASQVTETAERANIFYKLITDKKAAGELNDAAVQKDLLSEAERLGIREKATLLLSEALFTENILDEVKTYRMVVLRFCHENQKSQKYLLGGIEKLIGDLYKDKLLNKTAAILKAFYDNDILDEAVLIEWAAKASKKYVPKDVAKQIREKAAPLIKWLKEAEVEEDSDDDENEKKNKQQNNNNDDDEDDDDDLDIEYSHRVSGIQVEKFVKPVDQQNEANENGTAAAEEAGEDVDIDDI